MQQKIQYNFHKVISSIHKWYKQKTYKWLMEQAKPFEDQKNNLIEPMEHESTNLSYQWYRNIFPNLKVYLL